MPTHGCISQPCTICHPQDAADKLEHLLDMESYWKNENRHLKDQLAELKEDLEFMRGYTGFEAKPCVLCTYEEGVFKKACRMHSDIDVLNADLELAQRCLYQIADMLQQNPLLIRAQLSMAAPRPIEIDTSDL